MLYKHHFFNAKKSYDIKKMRKIAEKTSVPFFKIKLPDNLTKVLYHVSKF